MAQKVSIVLTDDMDGKDIAEGQGGTVSFSLDGTTYELDLSDKNADKFRGLFQDYIAVARKVTGSRGKRATGNTGKKSDAAEIRAWAKENGHDVPERGRIPADVRSAYEKAV